jgi:CO/xanthine dehydrogenase Mo-binding subunit
MLYGATVRSPVARGRLRSVTFDPDFPWNQFTIVTAADIPGKNAIPLILEDQPCLAAGLVNHVEEAVALVAHPDRHMAVEARRHVHLDIDFLPPVLTLEQALGGDQVIWGRDNTFKKYDTEVGDTEAAFRQAHLIVEGEYETAAQEQLYLEPQGALASANPQDGVTVFGSLQCPFYVQKALKTVFALPSERVRVVQCETGGGFGGKEDFPSVVAAHAALLAWKAGRPVKLVYGREEDLACTPKRHPSRTRHRTAVSSDGRLLGMDIEFLLDGGAYCTLSPVVLSRGALHAMGVYYCPNVRLRAAALATNNVPYGAFRGFGVPQAIFALERHIHRVARALGMDPVEFRRRNLLRAGQPMITGQVLQEGTDLEALLDRALSESAWRETRARFSAANVGSAEKRGIGVSLFMHGAGFTGAGERMLASEVAVEATREGRVRVLVANTEIGQGANTVLGQIVAEALDIPCETVDIAPRDTALVPDSGPTVASRTTMVVGKLLESACLGLRKALEGAGLMPALPFAEACRAYGLRHGALRSTSRYEPPPVVAWDEDRFRGDAYGTYAWGADVAVVRVDTATFEVRVVDFVTVVDAGTIINPVLAAGQVEGGVAQGIGFALSEEVKYENGRMVNARMSDYIAPTAQDIPAVRVYFQGIPYLHGPQGAKGLGELPADGAAPAVLNAVEDATGISARRAPCTPELLAESLEEACPKESA